MLLNLIDHLPVNSSYWEAVAQDEEAAAEFLDQEDLSGEPEEPVPSVRLADWSPEREALAGVQDLLSGLISATVASSGTGARPPRVKPAVRPVTAIQRLRAGRRLSKVRSLDALLVPDDN